MFSPRLGKNSHHRASGKETNASNVPQVQHQQGVHQALHRLQELQLRFEISWNRLFQNPMNFWRWWPLPPYSFSPPLGSDSSKMYLAFVKAPRNNIDFLYSNAMDAINARPPPSPPVDGASAAPTAHKNYGKVQISLSFNYDTTFDHVKLHITRFLVILKKGKCNWRKLTSTA